MTASDITLLRKSGNLAEAYRAATTLHADNPRELTIATALAWVLCDMLKNNASYQRRDDFAKHLNELMALNIEYRDAEYLYDTMLHRLATLLYDTAQRNIDQYRWLDDIFNTITPIPFNTNSDAYRNLLRAALKNIRWPSLMRFVRWWNLSNLRAEDYRQRATADGKKYMSLAETAYTACCRFMTATSDTQLIARYITRLNDIITQHPDYTYLPYYKAKLLLKIGERQQAVDTLRQFARGKPGEFWVWDMLAETTEDTQLKTRYYCKALTCRNSDAILVKMREHAALQLLNVGHHKAAKHYLTLVINTRQRNGQRPSYVIQRLMNEPWWQSTEADPEKQYVNQQAAEADDDVLLTTVSAPLKKNPKGFAFVKDVFVPAHLITNIAHNSKVTVKARRQFDRKKQQWGLTAVKIIIDK